MPPTACGSSLETRTKHASSSAAAPTRAVRIGSDGLPRPLQPAPEPVRVAYACAPSPPFVAQFGHVDSREDVRSQLELLYSRTQQLEQMSEMTLRIDTELELLRRSCFAQRNAQWGDVTPDQFEFKPLIRNSWTPQPANEKLLLRKMRIDGVLDGSGKEFYPPLDKNNEVADAGVEFVRDRPWPPQEFALKPVAKPKGRAGRKKAAPMAAVMDPVPLLARTCKECRTQSTPLWRTQTRTMKVKRQVVKQAAADAASLANAFVAQNMTKIAPQTPTGKMEIVEQKVEVDLCLKCYLKLERKDLFDKKRLEKKRGERRKKDQAAAAALMEKKKLKQQIQALKKQQKEHKKQEEQVQEEAPAPAAVILKFTREEIEAATGSSKERKRDRKHSRKDKKKKKKHRRKRELQEDSEDDGPTPIPSPAQMNDYVYADQAPELYATQQLSTFENPTSNVTIYSEPNAVDVGIKEEELVFTPARSSSRKRKSVQRTDPLVLEESPASASKKRRTASSSSQSKRATDPAPVVVAVPPAPSVKKRARTKKELARERELRALGQYCPVCSEVYEDDDQNTFVCCDSCELWVHGACDPSLTAELIAAMAHTDDKYICPLCAGR